MNVNARASQALQGIRTVGVVGGWGEAIFTENPTRYHRPSERKFPLFPWTMKSSFRHWPRPGNGGAARRVQLASSPV